MVRRAQSIAGLISVGVGLGLLSPGSTWGQEPTPHPAPGADEAACDTTWDGALFGILPGILAGGLVVNMGGGEPGVDDSSVFVGSAAVGALGGIVLDGMNCEPPENAERPVESTPLPAGSLETAEDAPGWIGTPGSWVPEGPFRPGLRSRTGALSTARLVPGGAAFHAEPRVRPGGRRADLYGAIVGGLLLGLLTNKVYCFVSEDSGCGLTLKGMAPGMLVGGILGAGIGSALAGDDDETEDHETEPQDNEEESEDRR